MIAIISIMKFKKYFFLLLLAVISILFLDIKIAMFVENNASSSFIKIFTYITNIADYLFYVAIIAMIVVLIKNRKNNDVFKKKLNITKSYLLATVNLYILVRLLKFLFGRARPYFYLSNNLTDSFTFLKFNNDYNSFPSGHTATACAFAFFLITFFNLKKSKTFVIILALLISSSRIILNMHYLSDVIFGMIFSISIFQYFTDKNIFK